MNINQVEKILHILNFTGDKISRDGKEIDELRPLSPQDSLVRFEIAKSAREEFSRIMKDVEQIRQEAKKNNNKYTDKQVELITKLSNEEIEFKITERQNKLIKKCLEDFTAITPELDEIVSLFY